MATTSLPYLRQALHLLLLQPLRQHHLFQCSSSHFLIKNVWCQAFSSSVVSSSLVVRDGEEERRKESGKWLTLPPFAPQKNMSSFSKELTGGKPTVKEEPTTILKWVRCCCPHLPMPSCKNLFQLRQVPRKLSSPMLEEEDLMPAFPELSSSCPVTQPVNDLGISKKRSLCSYCESDRATIGGWVTSWKTAPREQNFEADSMINEEMEFLRVAMGHENESFDDFVKAWDACQEDLMFFPAHCTYGLASIASSNEKLAALQNEFEIVKNRMDDEAKKATWLEQKIKVLTHGYHMRGGKL